MFANDFNGVRCGISEPRSCSLLRVMKNDAERVAVPVADAAHAVPHVDAIDVLGALRAARSIGAVRTRPIGREWLWRLPHAVGAGAESRLAV